ncbi:lipoyltransferase 1, mitochondrial [Bradysia coprophila]|uniref:lipoyltransferase 1, mitochondrial n=1 Tax=Bradysia coprophila TaxID=38358 RepID=UPI00187D7D7E|nr:lipoyltransferase 1, mitochondrial [Bradysia coprophila]
MATSLIVKGSTMTRLAVVRITNVNKSIGMLQVANYSNRSNESNDSGRQQSPKSDGEIKKSVFISQSYDVFTNLALEDWIYRNYDFTNHHILMLWANDPCVVVGRHQNPFSEANVSNLMNKGVELARRNSGGGAVFHDRGNLNCTFFTNRDRYNRSYNLNILTRALFREFAIKTEVSDRDDITLMGKKISGTAAKLGRPNAYHHCTLLVNSNKLHLNDALVKDEAEIVSNATKSVRSPIKNLTDVNRNVNIPQLISAIGYEYLRTHAIELNDEGQDLLQKQRGFQLINPTEKWFPGLMELRETFASWDWRFGKTPKFTVQKDIQLKAGDKDSCFQLKMEVEKGVIGDIFIAMPNCEPIPVVSELKGKEYTEEKLNGVVAALRNVSSENVKHAINNSL